MIKDEYNKTSRDNNAQPQNYAAADSVPSVQDGHAMSVDAEILLSSVAMAKAKIMSARYQMDISGQYNKPLYILVGEDHDSTQHYLHHLLLLDSLKDFDRHLSVAFEQPHDLLARFYNNDGVYVEDQAIQNEFKHLDMNTAMSLKLRFCEAENQYAYYAHKTLAHYIVERLANNANMSFASTDVSYDCDEVIELCDAMAESAIKTTGETTQDLIHIRNTNGMKIRNAHMARALQDHAQDKQSSIVVQFCGKRHLNGDMNGNKPEDSLAHFLKRDEAEIRVLPLTTTGFNIPENGLSDEEVIYCRAPSWPVAQYDPRFEFTKRAEIASDKKELNSKSDEASYIADQLTQCGVPDAAISLDQYEVLKEQYRADVLRCYQAIKAKYEVKNKSGNDLGLRA